MWVINYYVLNPRRLKVNIPIRTEEGNKIRNAFCSQDKENNLILSADYSQIELRLLAHVSGDEHLINAFNSDIDVHTLTASKVFGVEVENVTKDMRRKDFLDVCKAGV